MTVNKAMVFTGVATLHVQDRGAYDVRAHKKLQAVSQMIFTSLGLAQHFCVIDFLKELPLLLYVRILYFHKPSSCGHTISIGQAIDGVAAQAFVLLQNEPFTAFRTFVINSVSLGLSILWTITSVIIIMGGARNKQSKHVRWPWIVVTVCVCVLDLIATVTYANDSFQTRTLSDIMEFIGGSVSGIGSLELSTAWASWTMVLLYSRFVLLFVMNVFLVVTMVVGCNVQRIPAESTTVQLEAPLETPGPAPIPTLIRHEVSTDTIELEDMDFEEANTPSVLQAEKIPRPGLSQSFRKMKTSLFRSPSPELQTRSSLPDSLDASPEGVHKAGEQPSTGRIPRAGLTNSFRRMKKLLFRKSPAPERSRFYTDFYTDTTTPERSPQAHHVPIDKNDQKRTVNFPENLLSLPQRLENMIAEQQRRLDRAVVDTAAAGRRSPPRSSQSLPHLDTSNPTDGRRADLQGQLPWAYIPASAHRMRDQLPSDEDLPPVPLPDYSAIPSFRKASVHRAASSLSSLTQKKEYTSQSTRLKIWNDVTADDRVKKTKTLFIDQNKTQCFSSSSSKLENDGGDSTETIQSTAVNLLLSSVGPTYRCRKYRELSCEGTLMILFARLRRGNSASGTRWRSKELDINNTMTTSFTPVPAQDGVTLSDTE